MKAPRQLDLLASPVAPAAAIRHCKVCGICDPLPEGVSWATNDRCSDCKRADYPPVARAHYQTEPCPVKGCRGWRHPLATMCDACKSLIPSELRLALMRSASAERRPQVAAQYGPFDRPALQKAAIEAAAAARAANVSRATGR